MNDTLRHTEWIKHNSNIGQWVHFHGKTFEYDHVECAKNHNKTWYGIKKISTKLLNDMVNLLQTNQEIMIFSSTT